MKVSGSIPDSIYSIGGVKNGTGAASVKPYPTVGGMEQAGGGVPEQRADGITMVRRKRSGGVHILWVATEGIQGGNSKDGGVLCRGAGVFSNVGVGRQSGRDPRGGVGN